LEISKEHVTAMLGEENARLYLEIASLVIASCHKLSDDKT